MRSPVELLVCVYDERRDVYFEIHPERDFALDIYHHPYARVGYGDGACRVGSDQGRDQCVHRRDLPRKRRV
jgi:hypothetical protein